MFFIQSYIFQSCNLHNKCKQNVHRFIYKLRYCYGIFCANFYQLAEINLRVIRAVDIETGKISWADHVNFLSAHNQRLNVKPPLCCGG